MGWSISSRARGSWELTSRRHSPAIGLPSGGKFLTAGSWGNGVLSCQETGLRKVRHKNKIIPVGETELPDFTEEERHEIACIARYHRRALPSVSHEEFAALNRSARKRVSALAALLRIADALDWNHDGRVQRLAANEALCDDRTWTISLWVRHLADLDDELEHAN